MQAQHRTAAAGARGALCRVGTVLVCALLSGALLCAADERSQDTGFALKGEVLQQGSNISAGGGFRVAGARVLPTNGLEDREFTLEPGRSKGAKASTGCPCQAAIFEDGFESGDVSAWSASAGDSES